MRQVSALFAARRERLCLALAVTALLAGASLWERGAQTGGLALVILGLALAGHVLSRLRLAEHHAEQLSGRAGPLCLTDALAAIATRLEQSGQRAAMRHPITGLRTREHLFARMTADRAADDRPRLLGAVRFADFGRLSAFDPAAADAALAALAGRLRDATRSGHAIAQVDRDCFAVWFGASESLDEAVAELRGVAYVTAQEIEGPLLIAPAIEIGMAVSPDDGDEPDHLLTRAMVALAKPEASNGGELRLTRAPAPAVARDEFVLEQDLARAIAAEQLDMVFQPVVDIVEGRLVGAEALLRWEHPAFGAVSPGRFIPIVEHNGLADSYGLWVLNAACREARRWQDGGLAGLKIAVNLSGRQLHDPALGLKIRRTLDRHQVPARALELELTETAAMADPERTAALFRELHGIGVSLAIDDFGAGYSSLSYVKNLPFDKLKIDREFVTEVHRRADSRAICKALLELGRGLDLQVLAEGVEDTEEVACLAAIGCTLFQGYHFSRPLAGDAFVALARDPIWHLKIQSALPPRYRSQGRSTA